MAKTSATFVILVLVLSLLLFISTAEGRIFTRKFSFPRVLAPEPPTCTGVYGAQSGDTCFSVQNQFNLTAGAFSVINPNLICENLFVGQWLCVSGSA